MTIPRAVPSDPSGSPLTVGAPATAVLPAPTDAPESGQLGGGPLRGILTSLVGALAIATVSTLGDFIWATWIPRHRMVYGLTHGTLLFTAIGGFLGMLAIRPLAGALAGAALGFTAAGSFYLLAPVVGYSSMFVSWFLLWIALGAIDARLNGRPLDLGRAIGRGLTAAVGSGLAFYAVSGIWRPFRPQGWDYLGHFAAWTFAYLPGFAALLVYRRAK